MARSDRKAKKAARLDRKAKRQDARLARKETKVQAKVDRKATRTANSPRSRKAAANDSEIKLNEMKENASLEAESRLADLQDIEENTPETTIPNEKQMAKAGKYLQRRGVQVYKDPVLRAAQVADEREQEIYERLEPERELIMQD